MGETVSDTRPGIGEPKPKIFNPTITLGAIIQILVLFGTILLGWASLQSRITVLEDLAAQREKNMQGISDRLDLLNDKMNDIAVTQGETQTQLNDLAKRVDGRP